MSLDRAAPLEIAKGDAQLAVLHALVDEDVLRSDIAMEIANFMHNFESFAETAGGLADF